MSGLPHTAGIAAMLLDNEPLIAQVDPAMSAVLVMDGKVRENGYEIRINWLAIEPTGLVHGYWGYVQNNADDGKKSQLIGGASLSLAELLNTPPVNDALLAENGFQPIPQQHVTQQIIPVLAPLRQLSMKLVLGLTPESRKQIPFYLAQLIASRRTA